MRNHYDVLGVPEDAGDEEIKTVFRKLAKNYHPDRNPGDSWAERRFTEVNEAHEVLKDRERRAAYDAELAEFRGPARPAKPSSGLFWRIAALIMFIAGVGLGGFSLYLIVTPAPLKKTAEPAQSGASQTSAASNRSTAPQPRLAPQPTAKTGSETERTSEAPAKQAAVPPSAPPIAEPPATAANDAAAEWRELQAAADIPALRRYADKYAEAPEADEARMRVRLLIEQSVDRTLLGKLVASANTDGAAKMAQDRLEVLSQEEKQAPDDAAWERAAREGTRQAFTGYLKNFASGPHTDEARSRLQGLGLVEVSSGRRSNPARLWVKPAADGFRDCEECPELVVMDMAKPVRRGYDDMATGGGPGGPGETRARPLGKPLLAARFQITAGQWDACVRDNACMPSPPGSRTGPNAPMAGVSWIDTQAYVNWLGHKTGHRYRLLTQNEWLSLAEPAAERTPRSYHPPRSAYYDQNPDVMEPSREALGADGTGAEEGLHFGAPQFFEWVADCWREAPGDSRMMSGPGGFGDDLPRPGARDMGGSCGKRVLYGRIVVDGRPGALVPARFGDVPDSRDVTYTFRVARNF